MSESLHYLSVEMYCEPNIKEKSWKNLRSPLKSAHCPHTDHLSNFQHNAWVSQGEICIAHTILWRAANIWRAKNDPLGTLCVLTSPLLEEFSVLALLESARVVLGSSKVPFEFLGAHPEPRSDTRFVDESIDSLRLEV